MLQHSQLCIFSSVAPPARVLISRGVSNESCVCSGCIADPSSVNRFLQNPPKSLGPSILTGRTDRTDRTGEPGPTRPTDSTGTPKIGWTRATNNNYPPPRFRRDPKKIHFFSGCCQGGSRRHRGSLIDTVWILGFSCKKTSMWPELPSCQSRRHLVSLIDCASRRHRGGGVVSMRW